MDLGYRTQQEDGKRQNEKLYNIVQIKLSLVLN
jgi:hypothetical protein